MKEITIQDIGTIITGSTPPTSKTEFFGNDYLFIKPSDIEIGTRITVETETMLSKLSREKYPKLLIPEGSTCVVCIGSIGQKMTYAHQACFTNQQINSIIPNENYDNKYVFYLMKNNLHKLKAANQGSSSGRENVSKNNFAKIKVDVVEDIEKQRKIAQILSAYDELMENNQKQIKLLEEAAQRLYKEWFVDLRFPGYEDAEIIDGIPDGWTMTSVGELGEFLRGKTITKKQVVEGNIPVVAGGITPAYYHNKSNTEAPVITVSASGNAGFVNVYTTKIWASDCSYLDIDMSPYFYYILCSMKDRQAEIYTLQHGSAQQHVNANQINVLEILKPSDEILKQFVALIKPIYEKIGGLIKQSEVASEARDRLLPKLMSGEIEV